MLVEFPVLLWVQLLGQRGTGHDLHAHVQGALVGLGAVVTDGIAGHKPHAIRPGEQ